MQCLYTCLDTWKLFEARCSCTFGAIFIILNWFYCVRGLQFPLAESIQMYNAGMTNVDDVCRHGGNQQGQHQWQTLNLEIQCKRLKAWPSAGLALDLDLAYTFTTRMRSCRCVFFINMQFSPTF